ncbi:transcriptional regulator Spx [Oceanobacillus sp. CF4.6]|uniref:transcriptional regulator Spx n=1 Tax=Oceanobacillus sp. CF4.6 TaxID=3373080 RepID=UPI003EE5C4B3
MLTLYVKQACTSCRKAKIWLQENDIPFVERNIFSESLTLSEIKEIFRLTDNGTEEIISTRSKEFHRYITDLDQWQIKDLYNFIQENPGILKRPIIHDGKRLMVGYNSSQIRRFLPKSVRTLQLHEAQKVSVS